MYSLDRWKEESNRRAFFENYAIKKGFDPLHPYHWYSQTKDNILSEKVTIINIYLFIIYYFLFVIIKYRGLVFWNIMMAKCGKHYFLFFLKLVYRKRNLIPENITNEKKDHFVTLLNMLYNTNKQTNQIPPKKTINHYY